METPGVPKRDLETALIEKCWKDPEFKKQVVQDPKGMLERHTGRRLPAQLKIFIHEEDANTLHFSIPPAPAGVTQLSDEDLERVAGGTDLVTSIAMLVTAAGAAVGTAAGVLKGTNIW